MHDKPISPEAERFLVRVAWACEIEGLTQAEAADRFGVTRLRVNKALSEARRRGIVRLSVHSAYSPCVELETRLKTHFALDDAHVAPVADTGAPVKALIGSYLGHYLSNLLSDDATTRFGMGWGSTLNHALQSMQPQNRPDLEIVSVMGCVTRASDLNIIESARLLANLCNAQKRYFTAPLYAGSARSRNLLIKQDVFADMIKRIRSVDALAMTLGDMSARSNMICDGLPSTVSVQELIDAGAVGDALGFYLDANGRRVKHAINGCVVGMELADLAGIDNVILAAGGTYKLAVIRAFLALGHTNTLITDQVTALALLDGAEQDR